MRLIRLQKRKRVFMMISKYNQTSILITSYEVCMTHSPFSCYYIRFSDEPGADRKMLPQYDDPVADEVDSDLFSGISFPVLSYHVFMCLHFV